MKVDVRLLPAFKAVATRLSFSAAAVELGVAQPRISLLIRRLEEQLGLRLFDRTSRSVSLTKAGEVLLDAVGSVHAALNNLDMVIEEQRKIARTHRTLRLGSPHYTRESPVRMKLLDAYVAQMTNVEVDIQNDVTAPLLEKLRAGDLDFALATAPFDATGLESLLMARSTPMLGVPSEDPLSGLPFITPDMLRGRKMAVFPDRFGSTYFQNRFGEFGAAGVTFVKASEMFSSAVFHLAKKQRLLTLVQIWDPAVKPEGLATFKLVPLRTASDVAGEFHLVRHRRAMPNHLQAFWTLAGKITGQPHHRPAEMAFG